MKRLMLLGLMVLVSLVGMVGVSRAVDPKMQPIITQLKNIQQSLDAISYAVSALQSTTNPTTRTLPCCWSQSMPWTRPKPKCTISKTAFSPGMTPSRLVIPGSTWPGFPRNPGPQ